MNNKHLPIEIKTAYDIKLNDFLWGEITHIEAANDPDFLRFEFSTDNGVELSFEIHNSHWLARKEFTADIQVIYTGRRKRVNGKLTHCVRDIF